MDNPAAEIKKRLDLVEFIGSFVPLKKAGRNYKANCPFHQEKTPSFVVSPDRQIWHCFGACQLGGDAITFLMKWENITFFEAIRELADKLNIKLGRLDFQDRVWEKKKKLFSVNVLAEEYYHYLLEKHKVGVEAREYLSDRGVDPKVIKTFKLGVAPSSWDSLLSFLKSKGHKEGVMQEAGLVLRGSTGRIYDRFRKRLMFPLKDHRGNTIGFSGRLLKDAKEAKYVNTPETPVYHKREALFGLNVTKDNIRKKDSAVIVEGEFDLLSCFQAGISNIVAIKGSAVTRDQLMLLKRHTKRLTLALDSDSAGEDTTKRAIKDAERLDFELAVATYDFGKDPDDAVRSDPVKFKKIIKKPTPIYDYLIDAAQEKYGGSDAFSKKRLGNEVVPYIADIANPIVKSHYTKKLADLLDVEERSINSLIAEHLRTKKMRLRPSKIISKLKKVNRYELLQKYVLSLIFQSNTPKKMKDKVLEVLEISDFSYPSYEKLLREFIDYEKKLPEKSKIDWVKNYIRTLPKELLGVFDEVFLFDIAIFDEELEDTDINRILYEVKRLSLKKTIKEKMVKMDKKDRSENIKQLLNELSQVEKKLVIL